MVVIDPVRRKRLMREHERWKRPNMDTVRVYRDRSCLTVLSLPLQAS